MNSKAAAPSSAQPISLAVAAGGMRRLVRPLLAAALLALAGLPASAADTATFQATYSIIIKGITVGHAKSEVRFSDDGYAAAMTGSVSSLLRLFSDATADLAGSGQIKGDRVVPSSYDFITTEGDGEMRVRMRMRGGAVTAVDAVPRSKMKHDSIPVMPSHKRDVVDPLSAFLVATEPGEKIGGPLACNRTIKVFDGWQRFDLRLSFRETKKIEGRGDAYAGDVFVCATRYVPVAGHKENAKSVKALVDNQRLEVWLAPIAGTPMLAPYKILIGDTRVGDVIVLATRFVVQPAEHRASN